MFDFIRSFFSLGRSLNDNVILIICGTPILLFSIPGALPQWVYMLGMSISLYFLGQLFYRLNFRKKQFLASKRRVGKSTQWAKSFIYDYLSEIRRPLQGLIGVREVYDFNFENKDTQEYMEIVNHCSEHVVRLIDRMQLYSELQSGKHIGKAVRFTLSNILEDSISLAESNNPGKKVSVSQNISPRVLRDYFGPYELVKALVVEVIDNSIRYSPKSKVEISADSSKDEDHNLMIRIHDRGPGLSENLKNELQTTFNIKASSADIKEGSRGMGIPLIRSLAKALSANIKVKSKSGDGTEFEIHLKIPAYNNHLQDLKLSNNSSRSNQILIVEDDSLAQKIVSAMLNRLGYRSTIVSNGHDAVEICRRQKFGLILMDLEMPVMDGWEATSHILANCKNIEDEPIIIALSARNSPTDRARAEKAGCTHFMAKPINKDQLCKFLSMAGISQHFLPNTNYQEDKFDGLELLAGKTIDFQKMFSHYDRDMGICQLILKQCVDSFPRLLDELDTTILKRDPKATHHCLHQMKGEFRALLCNAGVHLIERLESHNDSDNLDFVSDLEQLNRYCDSLLKELSILSKHNDALA